LLRNAWAQAWPARPVRIIVPFQPGGSTDIFARLAGQKLTEHFGKQFYVENIAGATDNVGTAQAPRAAAHRHTLPSAFSSYVVNPTLFPKLAFDPEKDFAPVTLAVASLNVITVNPSLPARDLNELVALIKANPGKYSYATGGVGTQSHLLGEMLRLSLGLDIVHVPFNGAAPAIASADSGHTPDALATVASAAQALVGQEMRPVAGGGEQIHALVTGHADHGRGRISADRGRQLGRAVGTGGHAARGRPRASRRDRKNSRVAGREGALAVARLRGCRQHARGFCRPHQGGDGNLGQGRARRQHQGGVIGPPPARLWGRAEQLLWLQCFCQVADTWPHNRHRQALRHV